VEKIMRIRTLAGSSAATLAALVLAASPASAAEQHYNFPEQCYDLGGGYSVSICSSSSGQYNTVSTPSGNYNSTGKSTVFISITGPGYNVGISDDYHFTENYKQGELHVWHVKYDDTFTYTTGQICTYTDNYIFVNGDLKHSKPTIDCA
jgi:hypothetical protein